MVGDAKAIRGHLLFVIPITKGKKAQAASCSLPNDVASYGRGRLLRMMLDWPG
jgi:hypothetical protein